MRAFIRPGFQSKSDVVNENKFGFYWSVSFTEYEKRLIDICGLPDGIDGISTEEVLLGPSIASVFGSVSSALEFERKLMVWLNNVANYLQNCKKFIPEDINKLPELEEIVWYEED